MNSRLEARRLSTTRSSLFPRPLSCSLIVWISPLASESVLSRVSPGWRWAAGDGPRPWRSYPDVPSDFTKVRPVQVGGNGGPPRLAACAVAQQDGPSSRQTVHRLLPDPLPPHAAQGATQSCSPPSPQPRRSSKTQEHSHRDSPQLAVLPVWRASMNKVSPRRSRHVGSCRWQEPQTARRAGVANRWPAVHPTAVPFVFLPAPVGHVAGGIGMVSTFWSGC